MMHIYDLDNLEKGTLYSDLSIKVINGYKLPPQIDNLQPEEWSYILNEVAKVYNKELFAFETVPVLDPMYNLPVSLRKSADPIKISEKSIVPELSNKKLELNVSDDTDIENKMSNSLIQNYKMLACVIA